MNKKSSLLGALALLFLLGACGGGAKEVEVPAAVGGVPSSALASARAYADFTGSVPADERAEPIEVEPVTPPTSESDEPIDLV